MKKIQNTSNSNKQSVELFQEIKIKLNSLQKQKTEIFCMNIKNLTCIISKLMNELQDLSQFNTSQTEIVDLLTRIKLFLKLTRLISEKSVEEIKSANLENEKHLFLM